MKIWSPRHSPQLTVVLPCARTAIPLAMPPSHPTANCPRTSMQQRTYSTTSCERRKRGDSVLQQVHGLGRAPSRLALAGGRRMQCTLLVWFPPGRSCPSTVLPRRLSPLANRRAQHLPLQMIFDAARDTFSQRPAQTNKARPPRGLAMACTIQETALQQTQARPLTGTLPVSGARPCGRPQSRSHILPEAGK
jgi:hypothetical protein